MKSKASFRYFNSAPQEKLWVLFHLCRETMRSLVSSHQMAWRSVLMLAELSRKSNIILLFISHILADFTAKRSNLDTPST